MYNVQMYRNTNRALISYIVRIIGFLRCYAWVIKVSPFIGSIQDEIAIGKRGRKKIN